MICPYFVWLIAFRFVCDHGCRKGGRGVVPWILKSSAKKGCFLSFEWEKPNFTAFAPPRQIARTKLLVATTWKKFFWRPFVWRVNRTKDCVNSSKYSSLKELSWKDSLPTRVNINWEIRRLFFFKLRKII